MIQSLPIFNISKSTASAYEKKIPVMLNKINETMTKFNEKENLIGTNPLSVMLTNHQHHASFMINVFKTNDYSLLTNTLQWVFYSYQARGFKPNYFEVVLSVWIDIIQSTLSANEANQIIPVYKWMIALHNNENLNQQQELKKYPFDSTWETHKNTFAHLLLTGNAK